MKKLKKRKIKALKELTPAKTIDDAKRIIQARVKHLSGNINRLYAEVEEYKHDPETHKILKDINWKRAGQFKRIVSELEIILARIDGEYTKGERALHAAEADFPNIFNQVFEDRKKD